MTKKSGKKYDKPKITSEKIIETAALACGKCTYGPPIYRPQCNFIRRAS